MKMKLLQKKGSSTVLYGLIAGLVLYTATPSANAATVVTSGTGLIGDGVSLNVTIGQDGQWYQFNGEWYVDGNFDGTVFGGQVHSPSGAPDLFFRAGSVPDFPGGLDDLVVYSIGGGGSGDPGDVISGFSGWEGAIDGSNNWMKVIRNGDGAVSWAQLEFDFGSTFIPLDVQVGDFRPVLIDIPLYVSRTDGSDFSLAEAVAAVALSAVPEPSSTALLGLGGLALVLRRRR